MKTIEELKGMTQEELILHVQELESALETEKSERKKYKEWWDGECQKRRDFLNMMKTMLNLMN